MSNFAGPIAELSGVSADNFETSKNEQSGCFFLSHCHSGQSRFAVAVKTIYNKVYLSVDHMKGLTSYYFRQLLQQNPEFFVYCSPVSRLILSTDSYLSPILNQIRDLKIGLNPINVPVCPGNSVEYQMAVTCIPAGHCPGSVMYLPD